MGFIDIHTHIIPDVDDGSTEFEDSIKTIRLLSEFGIDTIIATPHKRTRLFEFHRGKIRENFEGLCEKVAGVGIGVRLYLGCEYYFDTDLFEDINNNEVLMLGNSKYILVEFGGLKFTNQDKESLFKIFTSGYKIVVAHVERNRFTSYSFVALDYLRDNSSLFQCDIMSLAGLWGDEARLFMEELIKRDYVDIISTDVHCKDFEEGLIKKGFQILEKIGGDGIQGKLMGENIKKRLNLL